MLLTFIRQAPQDMHELSIAQSLLEIVVDEANKNGLVQIRGIKLQVGEFAAVVPEALTFCFEMVSRDTAASGAVLEIETTPVVARCGECELLFEVENQTFLCPECGEPVFEIVSGRELSVVGIEGETGD